MSKKIPGIDQPRGAGTPWRARVSVKGKQVTLGADFSSQREAKDALDTYRAKEKLGLAVDPTGPRMTVEQWAIQWQELRKANDRRTATFLRAHIVPHFGAKRLGDVTPIDVQRWVNSLEARGLAPSTVRCLHMTLKAMFARAVDYDVLPKSPCRRIELPKAGKTEPVQLDVETLLLLERTVPAPFAAMIHLGAWAGLRWGECAALRWENVDLEAGVLHICEAVKGGPKREIGLPKGDKARVVNIGPSTVEVLRAHRRDFGSTDLLFTGLVRRRPLHYDNFRQGVWVPAVKQLGLDPKPTFHDLRHAYAAHMRRMGVAPDVLTAAMGHEKVEFNANTYGWVRQDHQAVVVDAVERAIHGG